MESNCESLEEDSSSITTKDFLEFLKITCQVNASIGNPDVHADDDIDYNSLASNELINKFLQSSEKETESSSGASGGDSKSKEKKEKVTRRKSINANDAKGRRQKTECGDGKPSIHPSLKEKLDEILNEGILDPVLPFICPQTSNTTVQSTINLSTKPSKLLKIRDVSPSLGSKQQPVTQENDKKDAISDSSTSKSPVATEPILSKPKEIKMPPRRSLGHIHGQYDDKKLNAEVVIHVCDEVKNTSKDFSCPQHLLVSKMGYFADVTAGQRLEDMDISVHCDLQIFDWLMKWVKKDTVPQENWPVLDANNVVPILVSASFLQMDPLLVDCLSFCHSRLNEVVRASANLSCLNDSIITRLAAMFTNLELEMIKDKKERITPRLWTKMIQSLCEPEPQALRGHYFSLCGLFRCSRCGKYLTQSVSSHVNCIPGNMRLNRWGQLISQHTRDTSWQITNYVALLFKELKSWRKVYWKLWGHCHFLYCCICETHFPTYQMNWCQFHPETPQFLGPITEGRIAGPAGRYPCCGQQAFRYETLPGPNGCQFREHSALVETDRDRAILTLAQIAGEGNCLYEAHPTKPPNQGNSEPRWAGISLMPTKCRQGLLPPLHVDEYHNKTGRKAKPNPCFIDSSSDTDTSEHTDRKCLRRRISSSSDGCESENSSPRLHRGKSQRRRNRTSGGRYWSGEMSARSNQDNQREFEERVMKQVIAMVCKKIGTDSNVHHHNYQNGGTYVRLEAEWKEQVRQKNLNKPKLK